MKKIKIMCVSVLLSLGLFCSVQSVGFCAETYTLTADQLETLQTNLTVLQQNNEKLKTLLMESNQDLTIASEQSADLSNQIVTLDSQLTESQNQIVTLKQQLVMLKQQTVAAQTSLQTANEELASASASFKKYEKEQEQIQSKLRTQKNMWEVIAALSLGYVIAK
jgi:chromosome segregation ATPase